MRLSPDAGATRVKVTFRGVTQSGADSDWRWGLVATDASLTKSRYSALERGSDAELTFCVNEGEPLFLVVMATPSVQQHIVWDQAYPSIYRYPYMIALEGAWPDGYAVACRRLVRPVHVGRTAAAASSAVHPRASTSGRTRRSSAAP